MRKLKNFWLNIPRPTRVIINILAIILVASAFYVSIGAPTLTEEQAFRREERANLVGPSTILFHEKVENYRYGTLILGETKHGVITWVDDSWNGFNYHEKTGDITVVTAPSTWFDFGMENWEVALPVFVVDDYPEAVQAVLELNIQGVFVHNLNGKRLEEPLDHHFTLSSHRGDDGFFYFPLSLPYLDAFDDQGNETGATHGVDGYALDALADTFTNAMTAVNPQSNVSVTATVELFDESGALLVTRDLVLRSLSDQAE